MSKSNPFIPAGILAGARCGKVGGFGMDVPIGILRDIPVGNLSGILAGVLFAVLAACSGPSGVFFPAEPDVRVLILHTVDEIDFRTGGPLTIATDADTVVIDEDEVMTFTLRKERDRVALYRNRAGMKPGQASQKLVRASGSMRLRSGDGFTINDVPYGIGWWWGGTEDRDYRGELHIYPNEMAMLDVVLTLPMETYLKGVIPYEIGPDSPLEALKAQAVAARTEIVQTLVTGKYRTPHYDVCADVECQVYGGNSRRSTRSDSAVVLTRAEILLYHGNVIDAYYASNCGGKSERVEKVWPWRGGPQPYLDSRYDMEEIPPDLADPQTDIMTWLREPPESWCNPYIHTDLPTWSKANFRWRREIGPADFDPSFAGTDSLDIVERGESGRIHRLRVWIDGEARDLDFELAIRQMVVPPLRSSAFVFHRTDTVWVFEGAGWGHGVGMCQSGAVTQANRGRDYRRILDHYFPGTDRQVSFP